MKAGITNNGNYIFYNIYTLPASIKLVVQSIHKDWGMEIENARYPVFTENSQHLIYMRGNDSLCLLTLGTNVRSYIPHIRSFKLFKRGKTDWIAYHTFDDELRLRDIRTEKEQSFTDVKEYMFSENENILVLKKISKKDSAVTQSLFWVNLYSNNQQTIWQGVNADNMVLNKTGTQLAFMAADQSLAKRSCWYYKAQTANAINMVNDPPANVDSTMQLDGISEFSKDGSKLFITLKEKEASLPKPDAIKVDVWSYADSKLQSTQLNEIGARSYLAVIHLADHSITRLQQENDFINLRTDSIICMLSSQGDDHEKHWNSKSEQCSYLISVNDKIPKRIETDSVLFFAISPNGKYLLGRTGNWSNFYSYELKTGIINNVTNTLPVLGDMIERDDDGLDRPIFQKSRGVFFVAWLNNSTIIVRDEFDIWQLDPSNKTAPINLTNSYGRKHKFVFRLAGIYDPKSISTDTELILSAFDKTNKNGGFYKITIGKTADPELLTMGPYLYDPGVRRDFPVKARDANVYLVKRESSEQSPNLYSTKDFKKFTALSEIYPEKKYNWMTSTLLNFTTIDGRTEQGILYKPENFSTEKKYPVILYYYERKSQNLNKYQAPEVPSGGDLDIAWFVSNGYLVFTPDIHYRTGEPGDGAYNSIAAAANYLAQFPWVNAKKMGLQGHSHGGYETNYVVTRTDQFAAAVSSSGMSDFVSYYGNYSQYFPEVWQLRIGATLWERQDLYIKNSPIFSADKVNTPILIINNQKDANVPFDQGLEWFTAFRRLGKRAWMLQYDDGGHGVGGDDYIDYILRMTQFFDHYLKDSAAPVWMTRGIPASQKGKTLGYEMDTEIKTPPEGGLLNEEERQKFEALKHRKPITVTFE